MFPILSCSYRTILPVFMALPVRRPVRADWLVAGNRHQEVSVLALHLLLS